MELGSFLWESKGRLAGWGWTSDLNLVVVEDNGRAAMYTLHGRKARELSLGAEVETQVCVPMRSRGKETQANDGCML